MKPQKGSSSIQERENQINIICRFYFSKNPSGTQRTEPPVDRFALIDIHLSPSLIIKRGAPRLRITVLNINEFNEFNERW